DLPFAISYNWTDESGGSGYVDAQGRMRPQMQARVGGMIAQLANYQYVRRLPGGDAASFVLLFRHIQTGDWKVAYWHALNARVVAIQTKQGRLPLMLAQIPQYRSLGGNAF